MKPLCVDLDGTLIKSDTLLELFLKGLKENPLETFKSLLLLKEGKASFKERLATLVELEVADLTFRQEVLTFVKAQPKHREIVLATGAHRIVADRIATQTGLFDNVLATDSSTNLIGSNKLDCLVAKYGEDGFDYIGNDRVDWPIFEAADSKYLVASKSKFLDKSQERFINLKVFEIDNPSVKDWFNLLRVHQWVKNLLIFIPFLLEHNLSNLMTWMIVLSCFFAFNFLASATYIVNDLLDLRSDRSNKTKSRRPLPSGVISIPQAAKTAIFMFFLCACLLIYLPGEFFIVLTLYLFSTLLYSFFLKSRLYIDIIALAALHSLRIVAGTVAISAEWSFWLLGFSMFFFLSLATAKRVAELKNIKESGLERTKGRDYIVFDIPVLIASGVSSGYSSVLIVALYINSEKVVRMYATPEILWLLCPLLLYWTGRIWLITGRGQMHEDPIIYALKDKISIYVLLLCIVLVFGAVLLGR